MSHEQDTDSKFSKYCDCSDRQKGKVLPSKKRAIYVHKKCGRPFKLVRVQSK